MANLFLRSDEVRSIFQLLGKNENDISFSVAWALAKCPHFLKEFLWAVIGYNKNSSQTKIRVQEHERKRGFTDIEIELTDKFYIIIEAKRGWILPGKKQLKKYARRASFMKNKVPLRKKLLVAMSECSRDYSNAYLGIKEINGVGVKPVSWAEMAQMAKKSLKRSSNAEKRLIRELLVYLRGLMHMQKIDSNIVYVVALNHGTPKKWKISWIDIVEKRHQYFHPMGGNGWPKEPPNYIAFRYSGRLQSIHHIKSFEVVKNLHGYIKEIPSKELREHFLYKLGPAIRPIKKIRTGNIFRSGRVKCMFDTLFTCRTISRARYITKKRLEQSE